MSKRIQNADSDSDMEDGGAKLNAPTVRPTPRVFSCHDSNPHLRRNQPMPWM